MSRRQSSGGCREGKAQSLLENLLTVKHELHELQDEEHPMTPLGFHEPEVILKEEVCSDTVSGNSDCGEKGTKEEVKHNKEIEDNQLLVQELSNYSSDFQDQRSSGSESIQKHTENIFSEDGHCSSKSDFHHFSLSEEFYDCNDETGGRKRRKIAVPSEWGRNCARFKRMTGQNYVGFSRMKVDDKMVIVRTEREGRKMGPGCDSNLCKTRKSRHCQEFTETDRQRIFDEFWALSWKEKKAYVASHVSISEPKKKTTMMPVSRRQGTFSYNLQFEGQTRQVCKTFFLNTLGIREWVARDWAKKFQSDSDHAGEHKGKHQKKGTG